MKNDKSKSILEIGSWLFYFCWVISLGFVILMLFGKCFDFNITQRYLLIFFVVGIIILPFLKNMSIGNFFKIEIRDVKKSIEELREKIINLQIVNRPSFTNINSISNEGENLQTSILTESKEYFNKAEELRKSQQFIESLLFYKKAFELDKNNWLAAFYLGAIYLSLPEFKVDPSSWGFDDNDRLLKSIYYSQHATELDLSHFGQFMNLGIALQHLGGDRLLELSIKSFDESLKVLDRDPNTQYEPRLITIKGKCLHFKAQSLEKLKRKTEAKKYNDEAIQIFQNCIKPIPGELHKWLKQALAFQSQL